MNYTEHSIKSQFIWTETILWKKNSVFYTGLSARQCDTRFWTLFIWFIIFHLLYNWIKKNLHRRCMAVVSPWRYAVWPFSSERAVHGRLPYQKFQWNIISGEENSIQGLVFTSLRGHVKSSWPSYIGLHLRYNEMYSLLRWVSLLLHKIVANQQSIS